MSDRIKNALGYVAVVVVCGAILVWLYARSGVRFSSPAVTSRDYVFTLFQVQSMIETGWWFQHGRVGMPFGSNLLDFPMADAWHFGLMKAWSGAFGLDAIQTLNLHLLLAFPLAALAAYFALRRFGCGRVNALALAQLYAFLFFHIERLGHCFLASYYLVPLAILLVVRIGRQEKVVTLPNLILAAAIGSGGVYYAFFTCFFLAVAALMATANRQGRSVAAAGLFVGVIVAVGLANVWPSIRHAQAEGPNLALKRTSIGMVESLGLKLAPMLLPTPNHPIAPLRALRFRYDGHAGIDDVAHTSLGTVGSIGFLLLIVRLFRRNGDATLLDELARLNLAGVLLGAMAAGGVLFALLVTPDIRGYERIIVFIAFFSLAAVGLGLETLSAKWPKQRLAIAGVAIALLPFAIRDQVHPGLVRITRHPGYADADAVRSYYAEIERRLPPASMIAQLPHQPFPEGGPIHRMHDYEHLHGPLFTTSLRFTAGAMKTRKSDLWQVEVLRLPPAEMLDRLTAAGFAGVHIDRLGYADGAVALEAEMSRLLARSPLVSGHGRYAFFDLRGYRRPAGATEELSEPSSKD